MFLCGAGDKPGLFCTCTNFLRVKRRCGLSYVVCLCTLFSYKRDFLLSAITITINISLSKSASALRWPGLPFFWRTEATTHSKKMQFYVSLHDLSSALATPSTGRLTGKARPCFSFLEEQEDPTHDLSPLDISYLTWWSPCLQGDSMSRCFDTWLYVHGWLGPKTFCWETWHLALNFLPRPDKGLLLRIISPAFSLLSWE